MKFAADSSLLVRLYDPHTKPAEVASLRAFLEDDDKTLTVSELAKVEVLNVLLRRPGTGCAEEFQADLEEGLKMRLEPVDWPEVFRAAESLAHRFSRQLRPGTHDLLLVAASVTMGASWFLSFDRNSRQRPLAAAAGLKVWPPLSKDERGLVRHSRQ